MLTLVSEVFNSKGSSSSTPILLLIVGLLIGGGGGYFFTLNTYQPLIDDYEDQISDYSSEIDGLLSAQESLISEKSDLESQVTSLENENSDLESDLIDADERVSSLESDILTLESQQESLESQLTSLQSEISTLQTTLSQKNSLVSSLQAEVDDLDFLLTDISSIVVTQHYDWEFGSGYYSSEWTWDLPISLGTYFDYYYRERPTEWRDWVELVTDPDDDYYITSMVQRINEAAYKEGFSESEKVNFVIAFVQSLPYTVDSVTTDWDEYPRYPIETLFDRGGDCEDTSILVAALLDRLGYEVCLIFPVDKNHCAVGVAIEGIYGSYYEYEGTRYFYLETTGEGWEIGEIPPDYQDSSAYIYLVNP